MGRDNIGGVTALGNDAMHALGGTHVLAQESDSGLGNGQGIGSVNPLLRKGGGMCGFAGIVDLKVHIGQGLRHQGVRWSRMDHHGGMRSGKRPAFEQQDLSRTPISSAGVPMTRTVRPTSSATAAAAILAATDIAAMMLCPQACPTRASCHTRRR